jgi:hypothetical protein
MFCKKAMSKTFPKEIEKIFNASFSSLFCFVLLSFGCFSAMGVQKHYKQLFWPISKSFTKKIGQKIKNRFVLLIYFNCVFGNLSAKEKSKEQHNKLSQLFFYPGPFLSSDSPTHHGIPPILNITTTPTLQYTICTYPLKTPTIALFLPQYRPKSPRSVNSTPRRKVMDQTK